VSLLALRAAALAAALVLALLSRGDVIVLMGLLAFVAWRPLPALAVASALSATAWRWSSTALEDIAGAQAVLGPAGLVDPPTSAVAAWLGAAAVVLATPDLVGAWTGERARAEGRHAGEDVDLVALGAPRWQALPLRWLPPLAFGATAAVVVAGPAWGTDPWVRLGASITSVGVAFLRRDRRTRPRRFRRWVDDRRPALDVVAAVAGVAALLLVGIDAPTAEDLLDVDALVEGMVVAVAVALLSGAATAVIQLRSDPDR
jgi:hypothetical protein